MLSRSHRNPQSGRPGNTKTNIWRFLVRVGCLRLLVLASLRQGMVMELPTIPKRLPPYFVFNVAREPIIQEIVRKLQRNCKEGEGMVTELPATSKLLPSHPVLSFARVITNKEMAGKFKGKCKVMVQK